MRQVTIATDDNTLDQAIYVDGVLVWMIETIYTGDLLEAGIVGPIDLQFLVVELPEPEFEDHLVVFPDTLAELLPFSSEKDSNNEDLRPNL